MSRIRTKRSLTRLLTARNDYGRSCVPIVGSGVNIQAAIAEGRQDTDDWDGLLRKVARKIELSEKAFTGLPTSYLAKWETMLRRWARVNGVKPSDAENAMQKLVCQELKRQEQASKGDQLYGTFLNAGFQDILSLNFDRRIALHSGREKFKTAPKRKSVRTAEQSVYRHSVVPRDDETATRIWYPHGDTKKFATLKFGVRKYGDYITSLEDHRRQLMARWRDASEEAGSKDELSPAIVDDLIRGSNPSGRRLSWPMIMLVAPLVFIGCSLAFDEWPLWWMLHQRARILAGFKPRLRPPTVYLCVGQVPDNLAGSPCEIDAFCFDSFGDFWSTVGDALQS